MLTTESCSPVMVGRVAPSVHAATAMGRVEAEVLQSYLPELKLCMCVCVFVCFLL